VFGRRIAMAFGLAAAMAASGCRCGGEPEGSVKEARNGVEEVEFRELEVEFTGCAASTRVPPTCGLEGSGDVLRLWVGTTHAVTVSIDAEDMSPSGKPVEAEGGKLIEVEVPSGAEQLVVETGPSSRPGRWTLALFSVEPTPEHDRIRKRVMDEETSPAQLEVLVGELDAVARSSTPRERIHARRLRLLLGRGSLDPAENFEAGRKVMDEALSLGLYTEAVDLAQILAYDAGRIAKEGDAEELLDVQAAYAARLGDARWRGRSHYHRGALAFRRYEYGRALSELTSAMALFRKLGMVSDERFALSLTVTPLAVAGKSVELDAAAQRLLRLVVRNPSTERCEDVLNLNNAAWAIVAETSGEGPLASARTLVERALAIAEQAGCSDAGHPEWKTTWADTLLTVAMVSLGQGKLEEAKSHLAQLHEVQIDPLQKAWRLFADALYADASGDRERARDALSELESLDYGPADPTLQWRSATLRGRVAEALGDDAAALQHYLQGEEVLGGFARVVGVGQGREALLAESMASAIGAIRISLRQGSAARAAEIAGRSRSRAVALIAAGPTAGRLSPADRRLWAQHMQRYRDGLSKLEDIVAREELASRTELVALREEASRVRKTMREEMDAAQSVAASEVLARPASVGEGDCVLRFHPAQQGWTVFAVDSDGVDAESVGEVEDVARAVEIVERVLAKFDAKIAEATTVVVEPLGVFSDVDVHAVRWRAEPLFATKRVEYSLGLGSPSTSGDDEPARALVVADPATREQGRLQGAQREVEVVTSALEEATISYELLTAAEAQRGAVFSALESSDWFHFSGHGAAAGTAGWDSHIAMAEGDSLEVRDILALRRGPRNVILMGCETGQVASGGGVAMHLASAFVLAGADRVIATTKEIPDELALQFSRDMYAAGQQADWELTEMWRAAEIASGQSGRGASGLRVWRR